MLYLLRRAASCWPTMATCLAPCGTRKMTRKSNTPNTAPERPLETLSAMFGMDALATALLDLLLAKGVIDHEEARGVLESAMYRAAMYTGTFEGLEATKIIGDLLESGIAAGGEQSRP